MTPRETVNAGLAEIESIDETMRLLAAKRTRIVGNVAEAQRVVRSGFEDKWPSDDHKLTLVSIVANGVRHSEFVFLPHKNGKAHIDVAVLGAMLKVDEGTTITIGG
jgi:hypothetical protein